MPVPSSPSAPRPTPRHLAELVHHGVRPSLEADGGAVVVHVDLDDATGSADLGFWPVPRHAEHPGDALVGFLAPPSWDAIALVCSGRAHHLGDRRQPAERVITTALVMRHGPGASVIDGLGTEPLVLEDAPVGWVADVLARTLGRPTPPPPGSPALMFELTWLDQLAVGILARPTRLRNWRWMADRHPLRGEGPVPSPEELAARTAAEAAHRTWQALLDDIGVVEMPAATDGPPDGVPTTPQEWFDEGTLSRWLLRRMVPPELVLPDLLSVLPSHLGESLVTALVEVDGSLGAAA